MKKLILIAAVIAVFVYFGVSFYAIEHTETETGRYLITRTSEMKSFLEENREEFEKVADMLKSEELQDYHYFLNDGGWMEKIEDVDIDELKKFGEDNGIVWVFVEPSERKWMEFYQTSEHDYKLVNRCPILYLTCSVQEDGTYQWQISRKNTGKSGISKWVYNLIYNLSDKIVD